ncbi:MAG: MaoC/PaaZ C-terminal domain-containing protein [Terracidiphilus sp.]
MSTQIVASRRVSEELQQRFAACSGDRNPIHMDRLMARRTPAGLPVVHGVHTLLWALESLVGRGHILSPLIQIKVRFSNWAYLHELAQLSIPAAELTDPGSIEVRAAGTPLLTADLKYGEPTSRPLDRTLIPTPDAPLLSPRVLSFAHLENRSGDAFTASPEDASALFPHLSAYLSAITVAEMTTCSYIVGMECPGLHSILSKLDLALEKVTPALPDRAALQYQVASCDERFYKARLALTGRGIRGTLDVFMRTPPVEQPQMQALAGRVDSSEFVGVNALIIGGSRGLGEVTAKLLSAGGGTPTITYALGRRDAEQVVDNIHEWGGNAEMMHYDVCLPPEGQLTGETARFTHLFYFATSHIFKPKGDLVSPAAVAMFTTYYLQGFHDLCVHLIKPREGGAVKGRKLIVFYPSSIAVDERPRGMTEYAMAKSAGEQMCRDMNQHLLGLHILTRRLPRMRTDQTASLMPERDVDPVEVLLPIIREMKRSTMA